MARQIDKERRIFLGSEQNMFITREFTISKIKVCRLKKVISVRGNKVRKCSSYLLKERELCTYVCEPARGKMPLRGRPN